MKTKPFPFTGRNHISGLIFWLLCILLVNALTISMTDSIQDLDAYWLMIYGSAAIILGWLMGGSIRRKWRFLLLGITCGLFSLILVKSDALRFFLQAFNKAIRLNPLVNKNLDRISELGPLFYYLNAALERLWGYVLEAAHWLTDLPQTSREYHALTAGLFWNCTFWTALFVTGWLFRKKAHAIIAGSPVLILSAGILGVSRQETPGLIMTLGLLLLLTVLTEQLKRELRWQDHQIDFSEEIRFDTAMVALPVIAVILIMSITIPNLSIETIRDFYQDMMGYEIKIESDLPESLGVEQRPIESSSGKSYGEMPRSHLIGSGPELSTRTVMKIDTGDTFLPLEIDVNSKLPHYYWLGRSYDLYTGKGWKTSPIFEDEIPAGEIIFPIPEAYYQLKTVIIRKTTEASDTFYIPGIPHEADHRISAGWLEANDEYFSARLDAREYQVTASILNLPEELLQDADDIPPENIMNTYLQLPEELPHRVLELAQSITAGLETPYDQSKAIEAYLRQYTYTLELPQPPSGRDIVDYFLFDLKRGYCDYTASAMVILARAAGLPARLAVGYATGSYDYTSNMFIVTEAQAHAWSEVYIEPFGWVPFEPTAGLIPFSWEGFTESESQSQPLTTDESIEHDQNTLILNVLRLAGMILAIVSLGYLWHRLTHRKDAQKSTTYTIEKLYQRTKTLFSLLFFSSEKSRTAQEYHGDVISYLRRHSKKAYTNKITDQLNRFLSKIIKFYQYGIYAPQPLVPSQVRQARKNWYRLIIYAYLFKVSLIFS